jgi:hypothetical protein
MMSAQTRGHIVNDSSSIVLAVSNHSIQAYAN